MTEYVQSILTLLDQGIVLYRRNFVGFVLVSLYLPIFSLADSIRA